MKTEMKQILLALGAALASQTLVAASATRPIMGWSSWNTFALNISEDIIVGMAQTMATNGLKDAGYVYVNIDDGFFAGHDKSGRLVMHPVRFPNGLKGTVDRIHALGMKAGIYSDAGVDTCGRQWDRTNLAGPGLYGHDDADCRLHFGELGFDFFKVDFCGGKSLKLDVRERYEAIARAMRQAAPGRDVRLNVCRWAFPGTWASKVAASWRTTRDIRASWKSVRDIIAENLYLSAYVSPGHYNDLDMLEVGQRKGMVTSAFQSDGDVGFTSEEERTHFGMWCFLSSPLVLGCDVRRLSPETIRLVTNPELLEMNQNDLGLQGVVVSRDREAYVLVKDAGTLFGKTRYVALYNANDEEQTFRVRAEDLDLAGSLRLRDLAARADAGVFDGAFSFAVPAHGARFFRVAADRRLERRVYEAETAFLTDYSELDDTSYGLVESHVKFGRAYPSACEGASGGVAVLNLGGRETNDLVWKDVMAFAGGTRRLTFRCQSPEPRSFDVQIDGGERRALSVPATGHAFVDVSFECRLAAGRHAIRLSNASAKTPVIDRLTIE